MVQTTQKQPIMHDRMSRAARHAAMTTTTVQTGLGGGAEREREYENPLDMETHTFTL